VEYMQAEITGFKRKLSVYESGGKALSDKDKETDVAVASTEAVGEEEKGEEEGQTAANVE
jgi:hypothetical protein